MAPRRNAEPEANGSGGEVAATDRIARLLALIVVRDLDTETAALKLEVASFSAREIGDLLGVGPNYLHVVKNRRKGGRAKRAKKK